MRVWEFEDKKEIPSDLVREQDFILRVRRMQKLATPSLVLNFMLTAIDQLTKSKPLMEDAQKKLKAFAETTSGSYYEMSNGDVFLVWENPGDARIVSSRAIDTALANCIGNTNLFLLTFRMPENYALLRERTNSYIEEVRTRSVESGPDKVDESSGRLTAKNVDQIEHLLADLDVKKYGRTQKIYRENKGQWTPLSEEYFISFEELRREHFPKLDIARSEHFFFSICAILDKKLMTMIMETPESIERRSINLNLSIVSIMDAIFAQFVRSIPKDEHKLVGYELNCGDLFQNFSRTLGAIQVLKHEGFRIAIDCITPNMVPYLDLNRFGVDQFKIDVSKDSVAQFSDSSTRTVVERLLPPSKLIFYHCDNENALRIGREMGVTCFQGWLIDDLVAKKKKV